MKAFFGIFAVWGVLNAAVGALAFAGEPSERLKAIQAEAAAFYTAGAYREATEASKRALALTIQEFGAESEQASIQAYGTGFSAEAAGDFVEAEKDYRESLRIREIVYGAGSAPVATGLERLAYAVLKVGKPTEAEAFFKRELEIWRSLLGEHAITTGAYAGLGAVHLARADFANALAYYRLAVQKLTGQTAEQAIARSVIEADVKGHRETFIGLARAAAGMRSQPGSNDEQLTDETFKAGQRAWATSAASALAKMTARLKANDTELGRSIRALDDATSRVLSLHDDDMAALTAWSAVQQADPEYRDALSAFRATSIAQAKANAPVAKRQRELVDRLQDLLRRCPATQSAGCASSQADREAIARELSALSAQSSAGAGEMMQLSQRMQAAEKKLHGYQEFSTTRNRRLVESQQWEERAAKLRTVLVKRFPEYLSLAEPEPLSIVETQKLLAPDEALIAILTGETGSLIWAVTRERAEWVESAVGEAQLAATVSALRRHLDPVLEAERDQAGETTGFDTARAFDLYRLTLGPVAPVFDGKQHLIVVPTGPLTSLPLQVLVTEQPSRGRSSRDALKDAQWLIRKHALSVLPSVQSLTALRTFAASGLAVKPFFGIGDPILDSAPVDAGGARGVRRALPSLDVVYRNGITDLRLLRQLSPLPETADELRAVAQSLGASESDIHLREAATETRVKTAKLKDYRVLHFATHGLIAGDLSGLTEPALVLTLPAQPTESDDGLLTASEVATLDLNADWVVLSACNTAAGNRVGADALSGLARAFFFAGARALLVSHWAVESDAAVKLTTRTFAIMTKNQNIGRAAAFQKAMLSLVAEGQPPSAWAPFVIVGEGGVR